MKSKLTIGGLALIAAVTILFVGLESGCGSMPTKFERTFADLETNYVPKTVYATNLVQVPVPVYVTNPVPVFVTNQLNQVVPVISNVVNQLYVTNTYTERVPIATNMVPVISEKPNATAQATAGAVGSVADLFIPGIKGIVSTVALGLLSTFFGVRNRKWAAAASDASTQSQLLSQAAGVLTQQIETAREVMATTPQGQQAANAFTQWMVSHQAETGTIQTIAGIVKNVTDNEEAQKAAAQIAALMQPPVAK